MAGWWLTYPSETWWSESHKSHVPNHQPVIVISISPKITNEWSDVRQKLPAQKESKGDAHGMHQFWKSKITKPVPFWRWLKRHSGYFFAQDITLVNLWLFDIATEAMGYWVQW